MYSTETAEGRIKHVQHSLGFWMPVRITSAKDWHGNPYPEKQNGKYIYALPGGGVYIND